MKTTTIPLVVMIAFSVVGGGLACTLDPSTKSDCTTQADCRKGRRCVNGCCTDTLGPDVPNRPDAHSGSTDDASGSSDGNPGSSDGSSGSSDGSSGSAATEASAADSFAPPADSRHADESPRPDEDAAANRESDSRAETGSENVEPSSSQTDSGEGESAASDGASASAWFDGGSTSVIRRLRFQWLGRSCDAAESQDVVFTLNEEEIARVPLVDSCDCAPGVGTLEVTGSATRPLGQDGINVFRVTTTGDLSWATVFVQTAATGGEYPIWAAWPSAGWNEATEHPGDLCAVGVQSGLAISGLAIDL